MRLWYVSNITQSHQSSLRHLKVGTDGERWAFVTPCP